MIKGLVVNMNNKFNKVFLSFNPLNLEFTTGCRIIDFFSSYFSFYSFNKCNNNSFLSCSHQLDNLVIISSDNPSHALIITNTSIKNNIATSIAYVYIYNKPIVKTLHYIVNVNSMEAELFTIRCGINQATNSTRISKIIVVTDLIHTAKKIFDSLLHLFQIHAVSILHEL